MGSAPTNPDLSAAIDVLAGFTADSAIPPSDLGTDYILPGSWAEWSLAVAGQPRFKASGSVLRRAEALGAAAGMSNESAVSMLLWLGSVAMLNYTSVSWESGIWHPSGLVIAAVEDDEVPIDTITSSFIMMARRLGLDPIQDTVKEGPSGLISRLEGSRPRPGKRDQQADHASLIEILKMDLSHIQAPEPENIGNVRGLIYPSGRAFLSYLYDTPFFNTLDELIQHGALHVRGKFDSHVMSQVNVSAFVPFYQGALVNLTLDARVQNNMNALLRQMLVMWPTSGTRRHTRRGNIGRALAELEHEVQGGLETIAAILPPALNAKSSRKMASPYIAPGVGVRYTSINRVERLTRIAVGAMFWRLVDGSVDFDLTEDDYAIADVVLHGHEMGSRLVEIATNRGKQGHEAMRAFIHLLNGDSEVAESIAQATDTKSGTSIVGSLFDMSILTEEGKLSDEYKLVLGGTIEKHRIRWRY